MEINGFVLKINLTGYNIVICYKIRFFAVCKTIIFIMRSTEYKINGVPSSMHM